MTLCGSCRLGIDPFTMVPVLGSVLNVVVPPATGFFGVSIGFQGVRLLPGSCFVDLQLSDTKIATIE